MADEATKIAKQINERAKVSASFLGGGTMLTEPILVINQKAKFLDVVSEYKVFDQNAVQIGAVRQEGGRKWLRFLVNKALLPAHVVAVDPMGSPIARLDKQFSMWRPKVFLQDANGTVVGQFVWKKMIGKAQIGFEVDGQMIGALKATNWRAWNFVLEDAQGTEIGTISKTWGGLGKAMFTNADHYVLALYRPLEGRLAEFVLMSALCVDTVLKQSNGK
jgi:uncharacterized protein YxjI